MSNSEINLSDLNSDVARKLRKFDTSNDGYLSNNELISALITLQKQSDSYKKVIWFLIPLLCLMVLSIFGMTILAINLTKEMTISNGSVLTTTNGEIIQTAPAYQNKLIFNYLNTNITSNLNVTKAVVKTIVSPNTSNKKSDIIGYCAISSSNFYLSFKQGYYAHIKDIQTIDVTYLQSSIPMSSYTYTVGQRLWFKDSGDYYARFQVIGLNCPVSFVFDCATSQFYMTLDGECKDKQILNQYQLYSECPFDEDDDYTFDDSGRFIRPTTTPAATKVVGLKAASYIKCLNNCAAAL
jgi:hypothetical protein